MGTPRVRWLLLSFSSSDGLWTIPSGRLLCPAEIPDSSQVCDEALSFLRYEIINARTQRVKAEVSVITLVMCGLDSVQFA